MILENTIKVKNYKCFDENGGGFDQIYPINIIVGKNNSGKSSLIELIRFVVDNNKDFIETGRGSSTSEVIISNKLTETEISPIFKKGYSGGGIPIDHYEYGTQLIGSDIYYKLGKKNNKEFISIDYDIKPRSAEKYVKDLSRSVIIPFANLKFSNISSERDIVPEDSHSNLNLNPNGSGATNIIQQIVNRATYDSKLIEEVLLEELNSIVNPDIHFIDIVPQLIDEKRWEIYFEDEKNGRIPLSKMGSGIKTILLVLLRLLVKPEIDGKSYQDYVYTFEELENNLHPAMQRRLYDYIKRFSEKHKVYFFITTHSNIVIDTFGTDKNAQLIHVEYDGHRATTRTVLSFQDSKKILYDLDVRASDLLQSNGIIWVEGPSDRHYINKWINLYSPNLKEGLHYSIMFYGGRLLSNVTFDYDWFNKEIVPLIKINRNAFVVMDRDGKGIKAKLNDTKKRIQEEIGDGNCWITKGREIENYLPDSTIKYWLKDKHDLRVTFHNEKYTKLEDGIIKSGKSIKLKYNANKTIYSSEIVEFITDYCFQMLDLNEKVGLLVKEINKWNSISE